LAVSKSLSRKSAQIIKGNIYRKDAKSAKKGFATEGAEKDG
jgi:hypothetical protein